MKQFLIICLMVLLTCGCAYAYDGRAFGEISVSGNSTAETTTDATPRMIGKFDTNGESSRVTTAFATGFTIVEAGTYRATAIPISFSGTLSKTFFVQFYKDTTAIGTPLKRKLGTGGDVGAGPCSATEILAVDDVISLYHWSSDGGTDFTLEEGAIFIERIK